MEADRLFLERDCPDCGPIRAVVDMDAVTRDDFRGKDGQELLVFSSQSNQASIELLERFGLGDRFMPVLQTAAGDVVTKPDRITSHLRLNGMAVPV